MYSYLIDALTWRVHSQCSQTMVSIPFTAVIAASLHFGHTFISISHVYAFSPSQVGQCSHLSWSSSLSASGRGFGEKTKSNPKSASISSAPSESQRNGSPTLDDPPLKITQENKGSTLLAQLRTRQAEERNAELQKIANLRKTDEALLSDPSAAAIPERVAQRMGKRMLPFVGVPLLGSMASFVGFWYMATYRDMEFQPAVVATVSFVFLAVGLLVSSFVLGYLSKQETFRWHPHFDMLSFVYSSSRLTTTTSHFIVL